MEHLHCHDGWLQEWFWWYGCTAPYRNSSRWQIQQYHLGFPCWTWDWLPSVTGCADEWQPQHNPCLLVWWHANPSNHWCLPHTWIDQSTQQQTYPKNEDLAHMEDNGSLWSVIPNWEHAHSFHYDLFLVETDEPTIHSALQEWFINKPIFVEGINAYWTSLVLLPVVRASVQSTAQRVISLRRGSFGAWEVQHTHMQFHNRSVTKLKATQLAQEWTFESPHASQCYQDSVTQQNI